MQVDIPSPIVSLNSLLRVRRHIFTLLMHHHLPDSSMRHEASRAQHRLVTGPVSAISIFAHRHHLLLALQLISFTLCNELGIVACEFVEIELTYVHFAVFDGFSAGFFLESLCVLDALNYRWQLDQSVHRLTVVGFDEVLVRLQNDLGFAVGATVTPDELQRQRRYVLILAEAPEDGLDFDVF